MIHTFVKWFRGKTQKTGYVPPYIRADNSSIAALVIGNVDMRRRADE